MPLKISLEEEAPVGKKIMAVLNHYLPGVHANPQVDYGRMILDLTAIVKEERLKVIRHRIIEIAGGEAVHIPERKAAI